MGENKGDIGEQFETVEQLSNGYAIKELNLPQKTSEYRLYESIYGHLIASPEYQTLAGKTQVLDRGVSNTRLGLTTRMMHDMHVSQNAMKIAMKLLGKDITPEELEEVMLAKVIGLTHDLGHTPFGHDGEKKLQEEIEKIGKEYTFSHASYSSDLVYLLMERFQEDNQYMIETFEGTPELSTELVTTIAEGARQHTVWYDYLLEGEEGDGQGSGKKNESISQKSVRLADSLSFMVTDLYDLMRAGIIKKEELLEKLDKNGVEIHEDALEMIFNCLTEGGDSLRKLHEMLIDEAFKPNRRGTFDLRTTIIDDYKLLQDITDTYSTEESITDKKRIATILAITKYAEYFEKSKNAVPNPEFWRALAKANETSDINDFSKLTSLGKKIIEHGDIDTIEFSEDEIRYMDSVISATKEPIQNAKTNIQRSEMEACPTLMTLFIMQDEIQYKEILKKAPERLGNNTTRTEELVGKAFQDIFKLAYAASIEGPNEYLIQGKQPDLSKHNGVNIPKFTISKDGQTTNFEPLSYSVFCIQQMKNSDFDDTNYLKSIIEELGINPEKVKEILGIDIKKVYDKCREADRLEPIKAEEKSEEKPEEKTKASDRNVGLFAYTGKRKSMSKATAKKRKTKIRYKSVDDEGSRNVIQPLREKLKKTFKPFDVLSMTMLDEDIDREAVAKAGIDTKTVRRDLVRENGDKGNIEEKI